MSAANSRSHALTESPTPVLEPALFKHDRPRRIDRYISFFGESRHDQDDVCGEQLLESFDSGRWSER
jgi:hypothetical protein